MMGRVEVVGGWQVSVGACFLGLACLGFIRASTKILYGSMIHVLIDCLQSLFVAQGPSFKNQLEIEPFENIELYNLMTGKFRCYVTFSQVTPMGW